MKAHTSNTQDEQKATVPKVTRESSAEGTATIADNRPSTIYQRKLRETMNNHTAGHTLPIQRNTPKGSSRFRQIATAMGAKHGVDTSGLVATHNSSFPGKLNAEATIQGNKIHFAPGMDNDHNIKHEVAHAIDNTLKGTPKGDKVVNGQKVDTTRERVADRMAGEPIMQMKVKEGIKAAVGGIGGIPVNYSEVNASAGVGAVQTNTQVVQRKIMPTVELTNAGESKYRFFGTKRKFRALIQKVDAYHRARGTRERNTLLREIINLCRVWKQKNADKNKPRKLTVVEKLEIQAREELRQTNADPELSPVTDIKGNEYPVEYLAVDKPLFKPGEPKLEDVKQGALGDCYLMGVIGSLVAAYPNIIKNMMYDGGDTVTVLLYRDDTPRYVKVAKTIAKVRTKKEGEQDKLHDAYAKEVLWVQMLEKALAALYGSYKAIEAQSSDTALRDLVGVQAKNLMFPNTSLVQLEELRIFCPWPDVVIENADPDGWEGTEEEIRERIRSKREMYPKIFEKNVRVWQKFVEDPGHNRSLNKMSELDDFNKYFKKHLKDRALAAQAMKYLENQHLFPGKLGSGKYTQEQLETFTKIKAALEKGAAVNACTKSSPTQDYFKEGLVTDHQYTVLNVKEKGGLKYIGIRNPFGHHSREYFRDKKTGEMRPQKAKIENDGRSWIELSDFIHNFLRVSYAEVPVRNPFRKGLNEEVSVPLNRFAGTTKVFVQGKINPGDNKPPGDLGLKLIPNDGEGDCFYHAVYMSMHNVDNSSEEDQAGIRKGIADSARDNRVILPDYFTKEEQLEEFITGVNTAKAWVPDAGPHIAAGALGVRIHVYDIQGNRTLIFIPEDAPSGDIHLNYRGGNHYEAYVKKELDWLEWGKEKVVGLNQWLWSKKQPGEDNRMESQHPGWFEWGDFHTLWKGAPGNLSAGANPAVETFTLYGTQYRLVNNPGQGDCLFYAIIENLRSKLGNETYQQPIDLRTLVQTMVKANPAYKQYYINESSTHLKNILKSSEWGGHADLRVLAQEIGIDIFVYIPRWGSEVPGTKSRTGTIISYSSRDGKTDHQDYDAGAGKDFSGAIVLHYNGGTHYQALLPAEVDNDQQDQASRVSQKVTG